MTDLSDREIAEAAAEAGISPAELRNAMAQRSGNLPARVAQEQRGMIAATRGGAAHDFVETQIDASPPAALAHVRRFLEQESQQRGHNQGKDQVDLVDDRKGVVYRMKAESDGASGSIVRVDIDMASAKARATYAAMAGGALSVFGGLLGVTFVLGASLTSGVVAAALVALCTFGLMGWLRRGANQRLQAARDTVNAALANASTHEVRSLQAPKTP